MPVDDATVVGVFQSTRPARGATKDNQPFVPAFTISIHAPREGRDARRTAPPHARNHFNPRAPRGARQVPRQRYGVQYQISIHAPREGRDIQRWRNRCYVGISIHAPREGRDLRGGMDNGGKRYFNPRAPRGARLERTETVHKSG